MEKQNKAAELNAGIKRTIEQLANETDAARQSELFRNYLRASAAFWDYSWHNSMLIWKQRPDASYVGGFNTWLKCGRYVRRGEKGISILAPMFFKDKNADGEESKRTWFKVVYVFDISQTDGTPLPELPTRSSGDRGEDMLHRLLRFAEARGITVRFVERCCLNGAAGTSRGKEIEIRIKGGNLYGTTQSGGNNGCCGIVFELKKSSGSWTESILYNFVANEFGTHDGSSPLAGVIFDKSGNLYGTTNKGGNCTVFPAGCGTVFEISPSSPVWTESILYNFQETGDGGAPYDGLIFDKSGSLYGTTPQNNVDYGTVFKLSPTSGGSWTESVLHSFSENGIDGYNPAAGVIFYGNSLYGRPLMEEQTRVRTIA